MTESNRKQLVDKLRQRARNHLQRLNEDDPSLAGELIRVLKEHETYQDELESQNEELRQISQSLEESQNRVKTAERQLRQAYDLQERQVRERTQELKARNEILETIVDNIPVMITFFDDQGKISYLNPTAERIIGLSLDECRKVNIVPHCYPDPEYRREVLEFMKRATGEWKDITMSVADGRTLESSWSNVRLSDGTYIGIGIDISKRKQAEKMIEQYIAQLEWKNRELEEFASVASHDLQEPLRKIQAFGNMLHDELPQTTSENGRNFLARMIDAAERMQQLIRALLDYSRISSKANPFHRIDLHKIVDTVIKDLDTTDKEVKPVFEVEEMDRIEADEIQIRQLLQNLIANSINYTQNGETPRIAISTRRVRPLENSQRVFCEIRVKDNGIGFDVKYLDKIFQPFERLHSRRDYSGTGMGLAICRKIVERHGGFITAESQPGKGSTFIVTLPVRQTNHDSE